MHVLIVEDDCGRRIKLEAAFAKAGFQTSATGNRAIAESCIRCRVVDLLIMVERVDGALTHALSLLAECRNPMVETILLTPRCDPDIEELFLLLPSLHCLVAPQVDPKLIVKFAIAALKSAKSKRIPADLPPILLLNPIMVGSQSFPMRRGRPKSAVAMREFA